MLGLRLQDFSIHRFSSIFDQRLHWFERLFWLIIISISVYLSYCFCPVILYRYQNNATALFYETNYRSWELEAPSVTICSSYISNTSMENILKATVNIEPGNPDYDRQYLFLRRMATMNCSNLRPFKKYVNESVNINPIFYNEIATTLKQSALFWQGYSGFDLAYTEMGICLSTNHNKFIHPISDYPKKLCNSIEPCEIKFVSSPNDLSKQFEYFVHSSNSLASSENKIKQVIKRGNLNDVIVGIDIILNDPFVDDLPLHVRKCRRIDEPLPGSRFRSYSEQYCRMDQRITKALELCGCLPYIYQGIIHNDFNYRICSPIGLACLWDNHWNNFTYDCPEQCESYLLHKLHSRKTLSNDNETVGLILRMDFPKVLMRRKVIYDQQDFEIGIAGAIQLFHGVSYVFIFEVVFYVFGKLLKYLIWFCKELEKSKRSEIEQKESKNNWSQKLNQHKRLVYPK